MRVIEKDPSQMTRSILETTGANALFQMTTCQRILLAFTHGTTGAVGVATGLFAADEDKNKHHEDHKRVAPEVFTGAQAVRHLMEVAGSLDALMPGEKQVFAQFRAAVRDAREKGLVDDELERVLDRVTRAARAVQPSVLTDEGRESLVPLTRETVADHLEGVKRPRVAIVGTGVIAKALVSMLQGLRPDVRLIIVSRDRGRASLMALASNADAVTLEEFLEAPPGGLCLVGFAMRCDQPIVKASELKRRGAHTNPLLVLDFAMPRNAQPPEQDVPGLTMVSLDTLSELSKASKQRNPRHLANAREILDDHVTRYLQREHERLETDRLRALADRFEEIAKRRWRDLPVDPGLTAQDQRLHKWFDQTVRALRHEAIETIKRTGRGDDS